MDSEDDSQIMEGVDGEVQEGISAVARPACRQRAARSAGSAVLALAAMLCGADDLLGHGGLRPGQGSSCCGSFCGWSMGFPATIPSAAFSVCSTPQAFERAFRRFMAAFAEANGLKLTGVVAVDGKALRRAFERGRSSHSAAVGQRLGGGSAHGLGAAQGARPQRERRRLGGAGDALAWKAAS